MKEKFRSAAILCLTIVIILMASKRMPADTGTCGSHFIMLPFTDVMGNTFFCQIAEGQNWRQVNAGLLNTVITGLAVSGDRMYASTAKAGAFTSRIPQ